MDLDDLLEDLLEDAGDRARQRVREARGQFERRRRAPGFRRRLRSAMLYGSAGWVALFGSLGIASELATTEPVGTVFALLFGGIALPAVGTGLWAWRRQRHVSPEERAALAQQAAKRERAELPADVREDWVRLRRAQALVADLATQELVDERAVAETDDMVEQLRVLLTADRRATELGAEPSQPVRRQLAEVADLLVALAAEAVEHRSAVVSAGGPPATLVEGRDRLQSLRAARAEVDLVDGGDGAAAAAWIEQEAARRRATPPPQQAREGGDSADDDRRRAQPG